MRANQLIQNVIVNSLFNVAFYVSTRLPAWFYCFLNNNKIIQDAAKDAHYFRIKLDLIVYFAVKFRANNMCICKIPPVPQTLTFYFVIAAVFYQFLQVYGIYVSKIFGFESAFEFAFSVNLVFAFGTIQNERNRKLSAFPGRFSDSERGSEELRWKPSENKREFILPFRYHRRDQDYHSGYAAERRRMVAG